MSTTQGNAQVLNFTQAAALLGHKHKQPEPQTFKLTKCHDGVFRALVEAPKFRSGGRVFNFSEKFEWTDAQRDYLRAFQESNPNRNGK